MTDLYTYKAELERVVDGDTVDLSIDLGFRVYHHVRVRLQGVDTPEIYGVKKGSEEYILGKAASAATQDWFKEHGPEVHVRTYKTGKYGRWIGVISSLDGTSILNQYLQELDYASNA